MSIDRQTRELVRQRAGFACEFCGITETDAGGELTIDHYHPSAKEGSAVPDVIFTNWIISHPVQMTHRFGILDWSLFQITSSSWTMGGCMP